MCDSLLKPAVVDTETAVQENKLRQAHYYNKGAKQLRPLQEGEQVRVQTEVGHHLYWTPASVMGQVKDRSYTVKLENGTILRRNQRHLRPSPGVSPKKEAIRVGDPQAPRLINTTPPTPASPDPQTAREVITTRCGRVIKRPAHLRDFV
ncbi:hypothetical protein AALO_G00008090 [Alosa alosa]|uniref:Uncharacterized protein n=1 Tax=Alosa alosa TaxID=278164 RepID=A0AAV6HHV1_9TELE|nr:hypothetical protein AALO_G00008090 [Alosa alosa]